MEQAIQIRPYQPQDRPYLEAIIRKTWNYDRFCQPEVAAKMAPQPNIRFLIETVGLHRLPAVRIDSGPQPALT